MAELVCQGRTAPATPRLWRGLWRGLRPGLALALTPGLAAAQAPSEVTPRSLRPPVVPPRATDLPAPPALSQTPPEAPQGAEGLHVELAEIAVDGGYPEMAERTRTLVRPLEGRRVSVAELYAAGAALEQAYVQAGYFLVRVVAPEQHLTDGGVFRLAVVDGFVEAVDTEAVPGRLRRPVAAAVRGVEDRPGLTLGELQRRLSLANETPGARLRSTLARGERPGGARLILDGAHRPFSIQANSDNRLGPAFRDWGLNLHLSANSALGFGEQAYVFLAGQPRLDDTFRSDAQRRVLGGGVDLPLGGQGWRLNPEFTHSQTRPDGGVLGSEGRMWRASVRLTYPLRLNRSESLRATVSADVLRERQRLPAFDFVLSEDRLTVARAGLGWSRAVGAGNVRLDVNYAQGLPWLDPRTRAEALAEGVSTSRDSDPIFSRLEASAAAVRPLPGKLTGSITLRGQTSFNTVVPSSELFDLSGLDSLSPFTAGGLSADGGWSLRGEIERPLAWRGGAAAFGLRPYVFAAAGRALQVRRDPLTARRASALGIGLRASADGLPLGARPSLSLEFGRARSDGPRPDESRLSVSLGAMF